MNTQDVILGVLQKRSYTGYEMKHLFETVFSFFFDASFGTIYPTLSKMEQLGYITKESIAQESRPNKNVYTITPLGKEKFMEYLSSPVENEAVRSDFHMRMFFGEYASEETTVKWIKDAIVKVGKELEALEAMKSAALESGKTMPATKLLGLQLGIETTRAGLKVLQESIQQFTKINISEKEQGEQE